MMNISIYQKLCASLVDILKSEKKTAMTRFRKINDMILYIQKIDTQMASYLC